jgi:hypothetical protein
MNAPVCQEASVEAASLRLHRIQVTASPTSPHTREQFPPTGELLDWPTVMFELRDKGHHEAPAYGDV